MTEDKIPGLIESLSDRISPSLCVGPAPKTLGDIEYLMKLKVTGVLNVSHQQFEIEIFDTNPDFKRAEKEVLEERNINYFHIPTVDGKPFKLCTMLKIIKTINEHAEAIGGATNLYIHCNAGMSRSPAAIALVFIGFGHDPDETLSMIQRIHPQTIIAPDIWRSILKNAKRIKGQTRIWWQTKKEEIK